MHHVAFERFAVDGLKRAQADLQRELADFCTPVANFFQSFRREMKARRGSSNRTGTFGVHRLIALAVRYFIGAINVRRKRGVAQPLELFADTVLVMRYKSQRA